MPLEDRPASRGMNSGPRDDVPVTHSLSSNRARSPDSNYRWMGSITQDNVGDILVGYSLSSANIYPSIAAAGRVTTDAADTLEAEVTVVAGRDRNRNLEPLGRLQRHAADNNDGITVVPSGTPRSTMKVTQVFDWSTQLASVNFSNCH